MGNSIDLQG